MDARKFTSAMNPILPKDSSALRLQSVASAWIDLRDDELVESVAIAASKLMDATARFGVFGILLSSSLAETTELMLAVELGQLSEPVQQSLDKWIERSKTLRKFGPYVNKQDFAMRPLGKS